MESERITRENRINQKLSLHWTIIPNKAVSDLSTLTAHAVEKYATLTGPDDYALFVDGQLLGIIEAKKLSVSAESVLEQAKRYAKGVPQSIGKWRSYKVPFLYSNSGELIYFLDVRKKSNLPLEVSNFHSPIELLNMFNRDTLIPELWLKNSPVQAITKLRPYQVNAIEALEQAIIQGRKSMLVSMATGTGKTFTMVSSIYAKTYYNRVKSNAVNQSTINAQKLDKFEMPLPPLEEQKEIVRQVDKLFALVDKLEAHYQNAKAKVDKLSQSVLAKTFRGELVPQDPNDESAEKLLERIMEEKAKLASQVKKGKKKIKKNPEKEGYIFIDIFLF